MKMSRENKKVAEAENSTIRKFQVHDSSRQRKPITHGLSRNNPNLGKNIRF